MSQPNKKEEDSGKVYSNLAPEDLYRGATPEDIDERCLRLCQDYIGGSWANVRGKEDYSVKRIIGGISNQLYRVQLKEAVPKADLLICPEDPRDVTIKLYESKRLLSHHPTDPERHNDAIILPLVSQVGLGPKVYGIFESGFIQAYQEHRKVGAELQKNAKVLELAAQTLARVHSLKVPIRKEANWQLKQTGQMIKAAYEVNQAEELIPKLKLDNLIEFDIRKEYKELCKLVDELQTQLVFCHNDYLGSNILVTGSSLDDPQITLIDFEYATYGSRGYDLAVFLSQWGLEPNDYANLDMPSDEVMLRFIKLYIKGWDLLEPGYSANEQNKPEKILYETKLYMMVFFLFWTAFPMHQTEALLPSMKFDVAENFKFAENYYIKYQQFKRRL